MAKKAKAKKGSAKGGKPKVQITGYVLPTGDNQRRVKLDAMLEEHCDLQRQEDAALLKYVKPIRDKKNAVKAKAKADYGIPTAAFSARASLRLIELGGDEEVTLAVNEMFAVTPVGKGVDLVDLAEKLTEKRAAEAEAKTKATITEES